MSFVKGQHEFAPLLEATWRLLSGFEYGFGWALLSRTDRKVEAHIPGGADFKLVIKDEAFVTAAKSTYFLLLSACRLFTGRHLGQINRDEAPAVPLGRRIAKRSPRLGRLPEATSLSGST